MYRVDLLSYPNQDFSVEIEGNHYDLFIRDCDGFMVIDVNCNNETIITGQRLLPNTPIIPYLYKEQGNFLLKTENDELADWQKFAVSQFLYFASDTELAEIRGG